MGARIPLTTANRVITRPSSWKDLLLTWEEKKSWKLEVGSKNFKKREIRNKKSYRDYMRISIKYKFYQELKSKVIVHSIRG